MLYLAQDEVEDVEDEEERELGSEEGEEPLWSVHVRLDRLVDEMLPQVTHVVLTWQKSFQETCNTWLYKH